MEDRRRWLADMAGIEQELETRLANIRRMIRNVRDGREPNPPGDFQR